MPYQVNLVYFSPSGTTKSVIKTLADGLDGERNEIDLLRSSPPQPVTFSSDSPAVFAVPVFAGRVPAICADMLAKFKGQNTPAVAIVVYGNREYDDALLELTDILKTNGFVVVAAATFVAQHSVFPIVASERPDQKDKKMIVSFQPNTQNNSPNKTTTANGDISGSYVTDANGRMAQKRWQAACF